MGLLKTVFEVNLGLFGGGADNTKAKYVDIAARARRSTRFRATVADSCRPQEKTLILFVIRDHVGATPMQNLTGTLTQDMEKIWASLSKVSADSHAIHVVYQTRLTRLSLLTSPMPHSRHTSTCPLLLCPTRFSCRRSLRQRFWNCENASPTGVEWTMSSSQHITSGYQPTGSGFTWRGSG
jgi:hypothetical protein